MELIFAITLFAFSSGITPGPNNIMLMTSGVNFGIKPSLPHLAGICLGFPCMVLAIGLGLSTIFQTYPALHLVIKVLGVTYLLYPFSFIQAAAFQWVNPKGWIMAVGAIATFTLPAEDMTAQVVTIASVFLCVAFPCAIVWLTFGVALKRILKNERQQKIFNITMALLLVASIIPMIAP
jgi:threonine/homoserine/homoserine lactone efflux protein